MRFRLAFFLLLSTLMVGGGIASAHHDDQISSSSSSTKITSSVILVIRHAEKPDDGPDLAPAGTERANAYVHYFENYSDGSKILSIDKIYAAADTHGSERPRLTVEPLSKALGLPIDQDYKNKDYGDLANSLGAAASGKTVLICWHHGEIPALLSALGADPNQLLPSGTWPSDQYGWVIQLTYDRNGNLVPSKTRRINENLVLK